MSTSLQTKPSKFRSWPKIPLSVVHMLVLVLKMSVSIIVLPSQSCVSIFTKFICKTVVQFNADVC